VIRSANRDAAAFFEQALAAMPHLPETPATLERAIDLRFDLRSALWPLGESARILQLLRETQPLVERLGDARRLGRFNAFMSTSLWSVGRHDEAAAVGERALQIADELGDLAYQVPARLRLSYVYYGQGNHRRVIELNRRVVAALSDELRDERFGSPGIQVVLTRVWLGWSLTELGEFREARARVDEAVAIAETAGQPYSLTAAYAGVGQVGLARGDLAPARAALERGVDICRTSTGDITVYYPLLSSRSGSSLPCRGAFRRRWSSLSSRSCISPSPVGLRGHGWLSEVYRLAGQFDRASGICSRGLERARQARQRAGEASILCALGNVAADRQLPDVETAVSSYRNAAIVAFELGMRPLVAHCHLGLGKLYRRTGESEQSLEHLTAATTMYREMDMGFWLEKAEAAMRELTP
jgi:tetratricopeptide (TPR) repeat protein